MMLYTSKNSYRLLYRRNYEELLVDTIPPALYSFLSQVFDLGYLRYLPPSLPSPLLPFACEYRIFYLFTSSCESGNIAFRRISSRL
mmetsp:Transcript_8727/g.13039  ORF Transcript_8727/g.13039 Transcript_8727/m.13039 type:complete len:86 (+) Transcript_8727:227-484(+)